MNTLIIKHANPISHYRERDVCDLYRHV